MLRRDHLDNSIAHAFQSRSISESRNALNRLGPGADKVCVPIDVCLNWCGRNGQEHNPDHTCDTFLQDDKRIFHDVYFLELRFTLRYSGPHGSSANQSGLKAKLNKSTALVSFVAEGFCSVGTQ